MVEPSPEPEGQAALFDETPGEQMRRNSATTLFTSSGNHFVFDELARRSGTGYGGESGAARDPRASPLKKSSSPDVPDTVASHGAPAAAAAVAAITSEVVGTRAAKAAAAAAAAAKPLSPSPVSQPRAGLVEAVMAAVSQEDHSDPKSAALAQEFVEHFKASGKPLSSAVKQLDDMLRYFPRLMFVERVPDCDPPGQLELCCVRDALMQWVKDDPRFPALVFTSFERGLKHAGLFVTQSTHGKIPVKRWAFKDVVGVYGEPVHGVIKTAVHDPPPGVPLSADDGSAEGGKRKAKKAKGKPTPKANSKRLRTSDDSFIASAEQTLDGAEAQSELLRSVPLSALKKGKN